MPESPHVYIVFGIPDSERRAALYDLLESGLPQKTPALYFKPKGETVIEYDEKITALPNLQTVEWELQGAKVLHDRIEAAAEAIFFLTPGTADPAEAAEAIKAWSDSNNCQIARAITLVHCDFLQAKPEAHAWFEACIHFSDFVLLARRENTAQKWIKDFKTQFAKAHVPSRFELLKKGRTPNPREILEPEARRLSLFFDELIPIEEDEFEDLLPEDRKPDKYIERLESGRRAHPIPDIQKWIESDSPKPE
jgi:hypothetical protein